MPENGGDTSIAELWRVERVLRTRYLAIFGAAMVLLIVNELLLFGPHLYRWDWLLVTGAVIFLVFVRSPTYLPDRLDEALTRLANRRVLTPGDGLAAFRRRVHSRARRAALYTGA